MKKWQNDLSVFFKLNRPLIFLLHFILITFLIFFIDYKNLDQSFNLHYQDKLTVNAYSPDKRPSKNDFLIIEIDDESFNFLSQSYGSIRISMAKLLLRLKPLKPKCIIVNFLFYGKGMRDEEIYLTHAVQSEIPIFFRSELTKEGNYFTPLEAFSTVNPHFGFLNLAQSQDKITRKATLTAKIPEFGRQYDLSTQISSFILDPRNPFLDYNEQKNRILLGNPYSPTSIQLDSNQRMPIHYRFKKEDVTILKGLDVLKHKDIEKIAQNKIILIDGTASVYQNAINTPFGVLPESIVLINAIQTELRTHFQYHYFPKSTMTFILFLLVSLFFLLNVKGSFIKFLSWSGSGTIISFLLFEQLFDHRILLPYGTILSAVLFPGIYAWIIRYFHLSFQSHQLIKLASIDPLTGLYTFKYFCFLLQRAFIRQMKNKKQGLYLAAIDFYHSETNTSPAAEDMNPNFLKETGSLIKKMKNKVIAYGFNSEQNRCYIAFRTSKNPKLKISLEQLRELLLEKIIRYNLPLNVRIAGVDMKSSKVSSSIQLVQIIQSLLTHKKPAETEYYMEYSPSALISRFSDAHESIHPQTDFDYITLQLREDKKELEMMQKRLHRSVQEYSMAEKLSAMGKLSSYYAHELKNPLHNLLSCFEVLDDPEETPASKNEVMEIMKSEIKRVINLTKKMGSYFKPSDENPEEVDLNSLISSSITFLERKFRQQNIKAYFEPDPALPQLYLVSDQMKQVFLNLFLNAMEAMNEGGHLIVATFYVPPVVRITVTDTGIGIGSMDIQKIFEAFYTTKKAKGTGLGLFACYNIIQQHGGQLKVNSTPNKGTCFEIILPV